MEWWGTLLISVAGAIVSSIVTFYLNLYIEGRKQANQDKKERKEELEKQYKVRPRLELKSFKGFDDEKASTKSDCDCLLLNIKEIKRSGESLFFIYDKKALDEKNLCCVEYEFINTGETEIDSIYVVSNQPRTTVITNLGLKETIICNGTLIYDAWSAKRFIKPDGTFSIRVYFVKGEENRISPISSMAVIYMEDINGNMWEQPFFCPTKEVENSHRTTREAFKSEIDTRSAIECFKHPELW